MTSLAEGTAADPITAVRAQASLATELKTPSNTRTVITTPRNLAAGGGVLDEKYPEDPLDALEMEVAAEASPSSSAPATPIEEEWHTAQRRGYGPWARNTWTLDDLWDSVSPDTVLGRTFTRFKRKSKTKTSDPVRPHPAPESVPTGPPQPSPHPKLRTQEFNLASQEGYRVQHPIPLPPIEVWRNPPASSRSPSPVSSPEGIPRSKRRLRGPRVNRLGSGPASAFHEPIRQVSKEEAASPVPIPLTGAEGGYGDRKPSASPHMPTFHEEPEEPSHGYIDPPVIARDTRDLDTREWANYLVPRLERVGFHGGYLQGAGEDKLSRLLDTGRTEKVLLPVAVVNAMLSWWSGKEKSWANYTVSVQQTKNVLLRCKFLSSEVETRCATYIPYVAFSLECARHERILAMPKGRAVSPWKMAAAGAIGVGGALSLLPMAAAATPTTGMAIAAAFSVGPVAIGAALVSGMLMSLYASTYLPVTARELRTITSRAEPPTMSQRARLTLKPSDKDPDKASAPAVATAIPVVGCEPVVFSSNQANVEAALRKRSLAEPPARDEAFRAAFIASAYNRIRRWLGVPFNLRVPEDVQAWREDAEKWVRESNSRGAVKERNLRAIAELAELGITCHSTITSDMIHQWTRRQADVKRETVLKEDDGAPRQILGATPQFCVLVAPFVTRFTGLVRKRLQRAPTTDRPVFYAPGASGREVATMQAEVMSNLRHFHNVDQAKWDLVQGEDCGRAELGLFKSFGCPRGTAQLIQANLDGVHGFSTQGVTFKGPYTRLSGDPHTTVGNTLLSLATGAEIVSQIIGREPTLQDMFLCTGGDDGSLLTAVSTDGYEHIAARAGFPVTMQRVDDPAKLEFLGSRWTRTSLGPVYAPAAGRTIAKLAWSVNATQSTAAEVARGAAMSFVASSSCSPPLQAYVNKVLELTEGKKAITPQFEPWKMSLAYTGEPTDETWCDLETQYGWTREVQAAWVEQLSTVTSLGQDLESAAGKFLIDRDHGHTTDSPTNADPTVELPAYKSIADQLRGQSQYVWAPSRQELNARMHATNGNGTALHVGTAAAFKMGTRTGLETIGEALKSLRPAIMNLSMASGLTSTVAEGAMEGFVVGAWEAHLKEQPKPDEVFIIPSSKDVLVELCGSTTVGEWRADEAVAETVSRVVGIPLRVLDKLRCHVKGKPVDWRHVPDEDVVELSVCPLLLGGASISRSDRIINKITGAAGLQDSSRGALRAVLDPFHDADFRVVGLPDSVAGNSVVECFKQTFSLSTTGSATANWDCLIVLDPEMLTSSCNQFTRQTYRDSSNNLYPLNILASLSNQAGTRGGISAYAAAPGATMGISSPLCLSQTLIPSVNVGSNQSKSAIAGSFRVFSVGLEIENSTAPLYQQGNCIVWEQPMPEVTSATTCQMVAQNAYTTSASTLRVPSFPNSAAEAMLLGGSRQWHAKEGAYIVAKPNSQNYPILNGQCVAALSYENDPNDASVWGPAFLPVTVASSPNLSTVAFADTCRAPFNMHGAYFTGLSGQTTLNVNVRTYVEIFPSQSSNPLTPLAQPSAPYDEVFWRIFSECIKDMPPGVMLKENGLGDFLANIAGKVASFVSPIARTVGGVANAIGTVFPPARAIGMIADTVGAGSDAVMAQMARGTHIPSSAQVRDDDIKEQARERRAVQAAAQAARVPRPPKQKKNKRVPVGSTALVKYRPR